MSNNSGLSKNALEWALARIEEDIADKKAELAQLHKTREEYLIQSGAKIAKTSKRRLGKGLPKKLAFEAMEKYEELTIGELRQKVEQDRGYPLADATTRRVLGQLVDDGKISRREDGVYILIKQKLSVDVIHQIIAAAKKDETSFENKNG